MAASGFWPLFKPESSWGQAASHTCPGSSSAPLMLHLLEPRLCLPCTTHLLIVCWLKGWSRKCNSTHPTWSPGHPHVGDADWCPSAIHLISPSCVPALTEAVGTEANAGLVTVPKEGTSGTSQVSVTQGSIADLPSFLHLFCLFVFLVLKGHCSGCWLQWGVARKTLGSKCQNLALPWCLPSDLRPAPLWFSDPTFTSIFLPE